MFVNNTHKDKGCLEKHFEVLWFFFLISVRMRAVTVDKDLIPQPVAVAVSLDVRQRLFF